MGFLVYFMRNSVFITGVLFLVALSSTSNSVEAQELPKSGDAFAGISVCEDRQEIITRFNAFVRHYVEGDFDGVFSQLSKNYLSGVAFKDERAFGAYKRKFYSTDGTQFVNFLPLVVDEIRVSDSWAIRGCLVERIDGRTSKVKANLRVWKEGDQYRFSDISPVIGLERKIGEVRLRVWAFLCGANPQESALKSAVRKAALLLLIIVSLNAEA